MKSPVIRLKKILAQRGRRLPRGELWLGTRLFNGEDVTPEDHLRLADRLGHDIICLPVSDAPDTQPDLGYRYFKYTDIQKAAGTFDRPVFAVVDGPFQQMVNKRGLMQVLTEWLGNPEAIAEAYRSASKKILGLISRVLESPVAAIVVADDFASESGPLASPSDIENMFGRFYAQAVRSANRVDAALFLHACGNLSRILPVIKSWRVDGFCAVQSTANDLEHLHEQFDSGIMIMAGIDLALLEADPPPPAALGRFERTVAALGPSGNLIISSSSGLYKREYLERIQRLYRFADNPPVQC